MHTPRRAAAQFIAYLLSGGISLLLALAFFAALVKIGVWYVAASVLSDGLGLLLIFIGNNYLVFGKKDNVIHHAVRYIIIQVANTALQACLIYLLVEYAGADKMSARVLTIAVCAPLNFVLYKYFVYV